MIALLNLSVLGFVVFHDKSKRTQQGNLLDGPCQIMKMGVALSPRTPSTSSLSSTKPPRAMSSSLCGQLVIKPLNWEDGTVTAKRPASMSTATSISI